MSLIELASKASNEHLLMQDNAVSGHDGECVDALCNDTL